MHITDWLQAYLEMQELNKNSEQTISVSDFIKNTDDLFQFLT